MQSSDSAQSARENVKVQIRIEGICGMTRCCDFQTKQLCSFNIYNTTFSKAINYICGLQKT